MAICRDFSRLPRDRGRSECPGIAGDWRGFTPENGAPGANVGRDISVAATTAVTTWSSFELGSRSRRCQSAPQGCGCLDTRQGTPPVLLFHRRRTAAIALAPACPPAQAGQRLTSLTRLSRPLRNGRSSGGCGFARPHRARAWGGFCGVLGPGSTSSGGQRIASQPSWSGARECSVLCLASGDPAGPRRGQLPRARGHPAAAGDAARP
jgi:hypothetical protein